MPFFLVTQDEQDNPSEAAKSPIQPNKVPLFLIPSILGVGAEYQYLIQQLRHEGETRPIYVYYDPNISTNSKYVQGEKISSLKEQVELVIDEIKKCQAPGPTPYLLVGFSFGCTLAALAAQRLTAQNQSCDVFLIDGPAPEASQAYFSSQSKEAIKDFIKIVKYAAVSAQPDYEEMIEQTNLFDSMMIPNGKSSYTTSDYMDLIAEELIKRLPILSSNIFFQKYFQVAKQSIQNLVEYTPELTAIKLNQIAAVITQQTSDKYESPYGGWLNYTEKFSLVTDDDLRYQDHMSLLKVGNEDTSLTKNIIQFINKATDPKALLGKHLEHLYNVFYQPQEDVAASPTQPNATDSDNEDGYSMVESFSDNSDTDDDLSDTEESQSRKKQKLDATDFIEQIDQFRNRFTLFGMSPSSKSANSINKPDSHMRNTAIKVQA